MVLERAGKRSFAAQALAALMALPAQLRSMLSRAAAPLAIGRSTEKSTSPPAEGAAQAVGRRETDAVLVLDAVSKRYGALVAVDGISFAVKRGEIFGILGPNGAGKTTTLEMVEGLRSPDGGSITICGLPSARERRRVQQIIGVQLQAQTLWPELTVEETLQTFRSLYRTRVSMASLLERFTLVEKRKAFVSALSGGQKQRLALACAVVNDPEVVFLDEPTTGLDPQARLAFWDLIAEMREEGKTIVLTTHYMEEAAALCDRVAVMDRGRIIALGTPRELVRQLEFENTIECLFEGGVDAAVIRGLPGVIGIREQHDGTLFIFTTEIAASLAGVIELADRSGMAISGLQVRTATLEDVFISLTGRRLRD
jgi:ABC-2 type transport system ATP-binding protein